MVRRRTLAGPSAIGTLALLWFSYESPAGAAARQALTLAERVACREKVEDVYWAHRIWPKENPTPKPPRAMVMPREAIAARIAESLRYEAAIEQLWKIPISTGVIQAEMARQARHTQDPRLLRALWASLGNDPYLVAECLVRPDLAQRRLQEWYANDQALSSVPFERWWAQRATLEAELPRQAGTYRLGTLPKHCADDTWTQPPGLASPASSRQFHLAVWTGTEMIVWGGQSRTLVLQSGGRYSPATDTWLPTAATGAPHQFNFPTAVWTGDEMIVWGGASNLGPSGARYSPLTDRWLPMSSTGAPATSSHTAVWTGSEMIVWGMANSPDPPLAGRYSPSLDQWSGLATTGQPSTRSGHSAIWTGSQMAIWGGSAFGVPLNSGALYSPSQNQWTPISTIAAPAPRSSHSAIWTGSRLLIWGGGGPGGYLSSGGLYSPATNSWTTTKLTGAPSPRYGPTAVWTGSEFIVWGGNAAGSALPDGGRYSPASDTWTPTSLAGSPVARYGHTSIWTGQEMIVWGGGMYTGFTDGAVLDTGSRYSPSTDTWVATGPGMGPGARFDHTATWTGSELIVWGGATSATDLLASGSRYTPATDSWLASPASGAPVARKEHTAIWTGSEMVVWGGVTGSGRTATGGRYSPTLGTWSPTETSTAPEARTGHTAVWTGSEVIVWGGSNGLAPAPATGGRYSPGSNTWIPTATIPELSTRSGHTALWTGTEMIVWGGTEEFVAVDTGARYSPSTDSWNLLPTNQGPLARSRYTAVWTGSEMVVWGGVSAGFQLLANGGRYDPTTDAWSPTNTTGAPTPRADHVAVWSGSEMLLTGAALDVGRYQPDAWRATQPHEMPAFRRDHTANWTGSRMILWGGKGEGALGDGASYCAEPPRATGFFTVTPCRLFDSRSTNPPILASGATRLLQVAERCGIPASARAASLNLTVVDASGGGFLQAYAGDQAAPESSTLSFAAGQTRASNAMVELALDESGTITLRPLAANGIVLHVVVDVNGYFE